MTGIKGTVVPDAVEIGKVAEAAFLLLADPSKVYLRRAARFRKLAPDSPIGGFLAFMGDVCEAQHGAASAHPRSATPDAARIEDCLARRAPPFDRAERPRDAAWQAALDAVLDHLDGRPMPPSAAAALADLRRLDAAGREALADRALDGTAGPADLAAALFVMAGLQVHWSALAAGAPADRMRPLEPDWHCPVCGGAAVASTVDMPGTPGRVRYLRCGLCDASWRYVRAKCAACGSTKGVAYHAIEGATGPVRAETCDECRRYVKIVSGEKDPDAEPFADDLASTGLDLMVHEAGWERDAPNPFLLAG